MAYALHHVPSNIDQKQFTMSLENTIKYVTFLLAWPLLATAQKDAPILFVNPSFEDLPRSGVQPNGWTNCGPASETPPDVQPGQFGVTLAPSNGQSYLGLVVRDNETWEMVGQRISRPLEINQCYEFSIDLCRSLEYMSATKYSTTTASYATPARLIIWGGNSPCEKGEPLFETSIIQNSRWLTTVCRLSPKKGSWNYIMLEAYYKTPILFLYNGNVLVDNASAIRTISCGPDKMPEERLVEKGPKIQPPGPKVTAGTTKPKVVAKSVPDPPPIVVRKLERDKLKVGDTIRLEKVYFETNKYDLKPESVTSLKDLLAFLQNNTDVYVEVGGHTNNNPTEQFANDLSTNRAKAVTDWLVSRGIPTERLQYKGYGKKLPIQQNTTPEGRRANQRVEIKILKINE